MCAGANRGPVLVLASGSPRRRALLRLVVPDFQVDAPEVDETAPRALPPRVRCELLARKKALHVGERHPRTWVLAADTLVAVDGGVLGKPADEGHARRMLERLSGRDHEVWTGVALSWGDHLVATVAAVSRVRLELPEPAREAYLASGAWRGKAGAYGLQDAGLAGRATLREGAWSNVVGLPLGTVHRLLDRHRVPCRAPPSERDAEAHWRAADARPA